jgi:hypothetical protein
MDRALSITFAALAVLFSVWIAIVLVRYVQFRKVSNTAVLSWMLPRPWYYNLCLGIGFFTVFLTGLSAFVLHRPPLVVTAQALMAIFYTVVFPLMFRIHRGFYATGIWAERGFVPYRSIRWLGWKEKPELTLALRAERRFFGQKYAFLRVPGDYYGQARRILADSIKDHSLSFETSVLGLDPNVPTQERV